MSGIYIIRQRRSDQLSGWPPFATGLRRDARECLIMLYRSYIVAFFNGRALIFFSLSLSLYQLDFLRDCFLRLADE